MKTRLTALVALLLLGVSAYAQQALFGGPSVESPVINADGTVKSSIDKFYEPEVWQRLKEKMGANDGDLVLIMSGDNANKTRVQLCTLRLEMGDRLGQTPFRQGVAAPEHEDVLVILRTRLPGAGEQDKQADQQFSLTLHPEKFSNDGRNGYFRINLQR